MESTGLFGEAYWWGKHTNWSELIGFAAASLVFLTFFAKDMVRLRSIAIASNIVFIIYAVVLGIHPVLVLHAILLPLNITRLIQEKDRRAKEHTLTPCKPSEAAEPCAPDKP